MKITRIIDGQSVDIELTADELYQAYNEQKLQNVCCDVRDNLGDYLEPDDSVQVSDDFIKTVAEEVIENMECMGVSFEYALESAIDSNKADYLKEED